MRYTTHLLFAFLLSLYARDSFQTGLFFALFALVGALLPDLDHAKSYLGNKIRIAGWLSRLLFGHRGFYHSFVFAIGLGLALSALLPLRYSAALMTGYLSHLALDAITKEGVALLWPLQWRLKGFIRVGGFIEDVLFILLLGGALQYIF